MANGYSPAPPVEGFLNVTDAGRAIGATYANAHRTFRLYGVIQKIDGRPYVSKQDVEWVKSERALHTPHAGRPRKAAPPPGAPPPSLPPPVSPTRRTPVAHRPARPLPPPPSPPGITAPASGPFRPQLGDFQVTNLMPPLDLPAGERAARVLGLLRARWDAVDIIIETKETPEVVTGLQATYERLRGTMTLSAPEVSALTAILDWSEERPTGAGLVEAARRKLAGLRPRPVAVPAVDSLPLSAAERQVLAQLEKESHG